MANCVCVQKLTVGSGGQWCSVLAEYVRHNDRTILDSCDRALAMFETELLPCESFEEFLDVVGTSPPPPPHTPPATATAA